MGSLPHTPWRNGPTTVAMLSMWVAFSYYYVIGTSPRPANHGYGTLKGPRIFNSVFSPLINHGFSENMNHKCSQSVVTWGHCHVDYAAIQLPCCPCWSAVYISSSHSNDSHGACHRGAGTVLVWWRDGGVAQTRLCSRTCLDTSSCRSTSVLYAVPQHLVSKQKLSMCASHASFHLSVIKFTRGTSQKENHTRERTNTQLLLAGSGSTVYRKGGGNNRTTCLQVAFRNVNKMALL